MSDQNFRDNVDFLRRHRPQFTDFKDGVTGLLDSSDRLIPDAALGLDAPYTWVRLDGNRSATRVVCQIMDRHTAGFGVRTAINEQTGLREVRDILLKTYNNAPEHVINRALTPAVGAIGSADMEPGRIEPDSDQPGTLWIRARTFQWEDGRTFPALPDDAKYDLTADVAALSASASALAKVYADPDDGLLHVAMGAEQPLHYPFTQADADAIPLPANAYPLAALVLEDGQTDAADSMTPDVRYFDRRMWLGGKQAAVADVMMSADGFPMVDADGYFMVRT